MSAKPIFEQLQANADKKQEEYDAVTKALQAAALHQSHLLKFWKRKLLLIG